MPADERGEFLAELGLTETGLTRVIRAGYALLHLQTFFTVGPKEARAWTVPTGAKAPQAAGEIHTDFERGFRSEAPTSALQSLIRSSYAVFCLTKKTTPNTNANTSPRT